MPPSTPEPVSKIEQSRYFERLPVARCPWDSADSIDFAVGRVNEPGRTGQVNAPCMESCVMNRLLKTNCLVALALALAPQVTLAATPTAPVAASTAPADPIMVAGLAVANLDAIVINSRAFQAAQQQRGIVYKAQINAANARSQAINAELKTMVDKFNHDKAAAGTSQEALEQQAQAIQASQQYGQQEVNRILEPVALSDAYVNEQIRAKLDPALKSAMAKTRVSIIFTPNQVIGFNNAYNLSPTILTELNALIPSLDIKPPAGWEPLAVRNARAQQQVQTPGK